MAECDKKCDKCSVPYCSSDHLAAHRRESDGYCYPFRVEFREEVCFILSPLQQLFLKSETFA